MISVKSSDLANLEDLSKTDSDIKTPEDLSKTDSDTKTSEDLSKTDSDTKTFEDLSKTDSDEEKTQELSINEEPINEDKQKFIESIDKKIEIAKQEGNQNLAEYLGILKSGVKANSTKLQQMLARNAQLGGKHKRKLRKSKK